MAFQKGASLIFHKNRLEGRTFPARNGEGGEYIWKGGGDVTWSPYQPLEFRYFTHSPFLLQTRTLVWTPQLDSYSLSFCLCQGNFFVHLHCHLNRRLIIHANWYLNSSLCSNLLFRVTTPCLRLTQRFYWFLSIRCLPLCLVPIKKVCMIWWGKLLWFWVTQLIGCHVAVAAIRGEEKSKGGLSYEVNSLPTFTEVCFLSWFIVK
jgi:hypothetical protein